MARESAGTSSVMTLPAAIFAPSPILTGATRAVFDPTKTLAPDIGEMLFETIIIAGNGACPDIGARPHPRIADIGQMIGLGTLADHRLFNLDKIADMGIFANFSTRPEPGKGPDPRA